MWIKNLLMRLQTPTPTEPPTVTRTRRPAVLDDEMLGEPREIRAKRQNSTSSTGKGQVVWSRQKTAARKPLAEDYLPE